MAKSVLAELVTKMTVESTQFKKELERTTAKTVAYSKAQTKAANDSVFGSRKMSDAFRQAANSASTLQGPMGGVASRLSTLATGFSSVGFAATSAGLAISGITALAGLSIPKFAALEKRLFRTEALFASTAGAAGLTTAELNKLASEVAENTLASVDGVSSAINVLQTFKSISGDTFKSAIVLSQDLAAVMGTDIKNASLQLGKALEDPLTGLTALRRSGVSFNETQKEVIKNLVETGQVATAQQMILETLSSQVGGLGAAEGMGLAGAADLLTQRWDEMLEAFASTTGVGTTTTSALNMIAGGLENLTGLLGGNNDLEKLGRELEYVNTMLANPQLQTDAENIELTQRKKSLEEQIKSLEDKEAKELEIIRQAEIDKEQIRKDSEAKRQQRLNQQGANSLMQLEAQLNTEQEKIISAWEQRTNLIESLTLSEEEIRKRGYDNLLQLQLDYFQKSTDLAADELVKIDENARKKVEIEQQTRQQQQINSAQNFAQDIQTATGQSKKLAGINKAAAIANATIKTYEAVNNALAAPYPPPIPQIFAAGALAAGLANVAAIKSQPIAGARAMGGGVREGSSYLVGERGPELFTPNATGQISSNDNINRALSKTSNITINTPITINGSADETTLRALERKQKRFARMVQAVQDRPI